MDANFHEKNVLRENVYKFQPLQTLTILSMNISCMEMVNLNSNINIYICHSEFSFFQQQSVDFLCDFIILEFIANHVGVIHFSYII